MNIKGIVANKIVNVAEKAGYRKEFSQQLLSRFSNREYVYSQFFDKKRCIFIHTPKAAGTSIANAIYGGDPWHFTVREMKYLAPKKFHDYFKFSFVRNPWSRLFSTYHYAVEWTKKHPQTSVRFVSEYRNFEEFILDGLTETLVRSHYFFWPYAKYLTIDGQHIAVDFCGRFEQLKTDFEILNKLLGTDCVLPELNRSPVGEYKGAYTRKMINKVETLYRNDVELFGYEFGN